MGPEGEGGGVEGVIVALTITVAEEGAKPIYRGREDTTTPTGRYNHTHQAVLPHPPGGTTTPTRRYYHTHWAVQPHPPGSVEVVCYSQ